MKKISRLKILIAFVIALISFTNFYIYSYAGEDVSYNKNAGSISGNIVALDKAVDALDSPSDSGKVVHSFAPGDAVFVTGEESGYTVIFYQGESLYIKNSDISEEALTAAKASDEKRAQEVSEEMKANTKADETFVDSYMRLRNSQRNALIWKIVIGVLIAALLVVSVIIGIKSKQAAEEEGK